MDTSPKLYVAARLWQVGLAVLVVTALVVGLLVYFWQEARWQSRLSDELATATAEESDESEQVAPVLEEATVTTTSEESVLAEIKTAMAAKYDRPESEVSITVSQATAEHATGGVSFGDEMGGGWFLAAYSNGEWIIVADGNGTVDCAVIEPYNFPTSMVGECFDAATGESIIL